MKRYAELIGNYKNRRIKSHRGNKLDYIGEIKVALHNDSKEMQVIKDGERIAQLVIIPYATVIFNQVDELEKTERGENGFGSTGTM